MKIRFKLYRTSYSTSLLDWDALLERKERARRQNDEFEDIRLGTGSFALLPYGKKPYSLILTNRAFQVRLAERMQPSCHVQFFSEALWAFGVEALHSRLRD